MTTVVADISCGPGLTCSSFVGVLTVVMAIIIFVGSIYVILSAVFGPRMGYLVLAVAFFGWMIIFSGLWVTGYWISQGLTTPKDLGPRGTEAHWQAMGSGIEVASPRYPIIDKYPGDPWQSSTGPNDPRDASVGTVTTAVQEFMAEQANSQLASEGTKQTVQPTDFTVTDVKFAPSGGTSLAVARAYFSGGGPSVLVPLYHDRGNVPIYSWAFLGVSMLGFVVHLPFLDRAERKRKAVLTGGKQPEWRGPA
jgi:hypothetical protein